MKEREELAALPGTAKVMIDLEQQVITAENKQYPFEINQKVKEKLVGGLDDITLTLTHEDVIQAYEQKHDVRR